MLNLHVLGTIIVDAGCRAASVTIHRVVDTEHGLGKVTSEIMLTTLLNHWSSTMANQILSEPIKEELFEIKDFDVVCLPRAYVLTLILGTRPGKQECLGKPLIQSNSQQFVVARRTPDNVSIQEIFDERTAAHNDLHRNRGFSGATELGPGRLRPDRVRPGLKL